jgi:hypothetical protein
MNYEISTIITIAVAVVALSLTAAQHAGNTLVLGMPGGFVPLKPSAKPASTESHEPT